MEKKKKRYLIAGVSTLCCAALICGIASRFSVSTPPVNAEDERNSQTQQITVPENKIPVPAITAASEAVTEKSAENPAESEDTPFTVIDQSFEKAIKPEVTEPPKPEVSDETQLTDPSKPPLYETQSQATEAPAPGNEPANGETRGNMIYCEGFGWVTDEGGGGEASVNEEMYQNGNKIGSFG